MFILNDLFNNINIYEDTQDVNTIPQDFLNNLPHNNLVYQVITGITRYNKA